MMTTTARAGSHTSASCNPDAEIVSRRDVFARILCHGRLPSLTVDFGLLYCIMHDIYMLGGCLVRDCAYSHMLLGVLI
jgi:hypothetical protein